ncbi:McrC family protein [Sphingobacterium sp. SGL-16]|uniref:McrC family protein n=1 Tax=Sphingobacterium sp. SGL-16 TaxID=2710883 RepID=UPI0013EA379E|nr:restriction endonuclease [Sphingobacterium sp. SGL-16]NGM71670.1 restriction endonuclease [Sphingobacterium sp. SGL-16]
MFEHEALYTHRGEKNLTDVQLKALQLFYKEKDFPYYSLVHNGVRFCEYVGVLKVNNLTIEILPKADKSSNHNHWRNLLIDMMRSIGLLKPDAPTHANLKLKQSSILDMYLELFISEVEKLIRQGLIKKYRNIESNYTALKGKLLVAKQVTKNSVHQERFYIQHSVYDQNHLLHEILYLAMHTILKLGTAPHLISRYHNALLYFPDQKTIKIKEEIFNKIKLTRKTAAYQSALDIAKIILLNYHPDMDNGSNNVLALMFDMNMLWEKFVLKSLQRNIHKDMQVTGQISIDFWMAENRYTKRIKPDIVISHNNKPVAVLDTKWKNISDGTPSDDDLRQLYAYSKYHNNVPSYLVYPGEENKIIKGLYAKAFEDDSETPGGLMKIKIGSGKSDGMQLLHQQIINNLTLY